MMTKTSMMLTLMGLALGPGVHAAGKTYQVTGPVIDVASDAITVQKGSETWTIGRGADTKLIGEPKKGDKVTIFYSMTASEIDTKAAAAPKSDRTKAAAPPPAMDVTKTAAHVVIPPAPGAKPAALPKPAGVPAVAKPLPPPAPH